MSGKTPAALLNKPEPCEAAERYIEAFAILSRVRRPSEPISLSDIFLFADSILEDRLEFAKIILAGDHEFLEYYRKKAEDKINATE